MLLSLRRHFCILYRQKKIVSYNILGRWKGTASVTPPWANLEHSALQFNVMESYN